jgi:hypothetical protein
MINLFLGLAFISGGLLTYALMGEHVKIHRDCFGRFISK